jgi:2'-hydroxyisoflavone reductase
MYHQYIHQGAMKGIHMKLLILGGSIFLGKHIVENALAQGHEITLFNRGEHNPDLFPNVEKLRGDRNGALSLLQGRQWDAAIDTSGFFPHVVEASTRALSGAVKHYTFISSISVYGDFSKPDLNEDAPVAKLDDETVEEVSNETYGALKALCEQAAAATMPGRVLVVRPGLIVGPDDPTDRFTYWPCRVAKGGEMLAPGEPEQSLQFIDVRDLAAWIVSMIEAEKTGVYNATGPDYLLSMGQFLGECKAVTESDVRFTWTGETFASDLMEKELVNFQPWVPGEYAAMRSANCQKAYAQGLTFRPLAETIRATLDWKLASPTRDTMRSGPNPEQEQELLREFHEKH